MGYIGVNLLNSGHQLHFRRHSEAPAPCGLHIVEMIVIREIVAQKIIEHGIKAAACYLGRILHLQCAGCRITRIGKKGFFIELPLCVKPVESLPGEEYLSTYFKLIGPSRPLQG